MTNDEPERELGEGLEDEGFPRPVAAIIAKARRTGNIKGGLVLCDLCDNPASLSLSVSLSWTGCAPCVFGEADAFDDTDLIPVEPKA